MFKLLTGGEIFAPEPMGTRDVLIACDRIIKVENSIDPDIARNLGRVADVEIIDCRGCIICPGFVDQHVHITGGGGEKGPESRTPEASFDDFASNGITTAAGLLGADSLTRSIADLFAKAHELEARGLTSYIYSGSYGLPAATLTGKCISDLVFIDKVIGIGEIAISDHRSSHPTQRELKDLAWEACLGGMMGKKAGVLHIHVGDGKKGLGPLNELIESSDFPIEMFVPTHLNRNSMLFDQTLAHIRSGGHADLTAGPASGNGLTVPEAVTAIIKQGLPTGKVTVSSDGNGSNGDDICRISDLFADIRNCMTEAGIPIETALSLVTSNVAGTLGIYPRKGAIRPGSDADILVIEKNGFGISKIFLKGLNSTEAASNNKMTPSEK